MHGLRLKTSTAAELAHSGRPELCKQEDVDLMPPVKQPTVEWLQFWGIRADWPLGLASQSASLAESLNQQASVKARNPALPPPPRTVGLHSHLTTAVYTLDPARWWETTNF